MGIEKAMTGAIPATGLMGERGGTIIANTNEVTGDFNCLYPITETVVDAMTLNSSFTGSMASVTLAAGVPFYGRFTAITLTSGTAIAYNTTTSME